MAHARRGLHFVDVLASFAAAPIGVNLDFGRVDFDRGGVGQLGHHIHAGKRRVASFVGVERRNSDEAVDSALGGQVAEGVFARHPQGHRFDADFVPVLDVDNRNAESAAFRPALIHTQKHVGPIAGLGSSRSGLDAEEGVGCVARPGKEHLQLKLAQGL